MEVPSWAWQKKLPEVTTYLAGQVDKIDPYVWPFLRDNLRGLSLPVQPTVSHYHAHLPASRLAADL